MNVEISKKQELINIARGFFYSKGYNKTSIQNIIDQGNIAKGTFYHYFKSKEDLLHQFISMEVSGLYKLVNGIVEQDLTALEKFETLFKSGGDWKTENIKIMKPLLKIMMSDDNLFLRHTLLRSQIEQITPIYIKIIKQGVEEGIFHVFNVEYTAIFILNTFSSFTDQVYSHLSAPKYTEEILDNLKNIIKYYEDTFDRLLGVKKGSIHIADDMVLEELLKGLLEA